MRIYNLDESLDKLIKNHRFQIELIGEDDCWTYHVSLKAWDSALQRYTYTFIGGGTCVEFLSAYDAIAQMVAYHSK